MAWVKKNSLTYSILMSLGELASDLAYFMFIHPPRSVGEGMYLLDRRMRSKGISRLKKQGLIREYKKGGERYLKVTEEGRIEVVRHKLKQKAKEIWDGKWRIVVFDIPEATRSDRTFLRQQLKWFGFFELQKSVWIFPYDVKSELHDFIKLCKVELNGDIRFLTVEHIDNDRDLRRHFQLG